MLPISNNSDITIVDGQDETAAWMLGTFCPMIGLYLHSAEAVEI